MSTSPNIQLIEIPCDPHTMLAALAAEPEQSTEPDIDVERPAAWCPAQLSTVHTVVTIHGRPVLPSYQRITSARPPQLARYSSR